LRLLRGLVEAGETYVGGKRKRIRNPGATMTQASPKGGSRKAMVVAAVERGG
jgi:hypothetical protein